MTNILIWGIGGRLGKMITECINNTENCTVVGGVDKYADPHNFSVPIFLSATDINVDADVIIDFSKPDAVFDILPFCLSKNIGAVLCTTGYTEKHQAFINGYADKLPLFQSSNMTIGVNLMIDLCRKACRTLGSKFEIEIVEKHHHLKVDSPSGTALSIAKAINEEFDNSKEFVYGRHSMNERRTPQEIGIHAIRGGTIVGEHEVLFIGNDEILSIKHEAHSKAVFAEGAIKAAQFIKGKRPKIYDMIDLINQ